MSIRSHHVRPLISCVALLLCVQPLTALSADGADKSSANTTSILLKTAHETITQNSDKFILVHKAEALVAKLSILESQTDAWSALKRARSIKNPFYSSLALSGIATTELHSDPSASTTHFREALARSEQINSWTGSHATSLGFMIDLLPSFPQRASRELLKASKETFDAWEGSDYQKSASLLSIAKATTAIQPETAKGLLYDVALKSNHYSASIEYLATFMAQQSMQEAMRLSEAHYTARQDWPNDQYFRRAVLIEQAKTDFAGAFEEIKKMRKLDQEIAAVKLAEFLLKHKRKADTQQVVAHIESLSSDFNWTQTSLKTLRGKLKQKEQLSRLSDGETTANAIDEFVTNPNAQRLLAISNSKHVAFANERQVREFIKVSLPLTKEIREMGYPRHGSPRSATLGLLVVCSALFDEIPEAIEIATQINPPELRANYLLAAYEARHPIDPTVANWPIHFWQHTTVSISSPKSRDDEVFREGQSNVKQDAQQPATTTKSTIKPKTSMVSPQTSDWERYDGSCPKTHYPIIIRGEALKGDGETYRAIFVKIPSKDFLYVALHGLRSAQYEKKAKELSDQLYTLIYHQQFRAMDGIRHQAVWVKTAPQPNSDAQKKLKRRSTDLVLLKARLKSQESMRTLHRDFQMGSSTHADYLGPGPEVGGTPASVMTFFRDSQDKYYRLFDRTRIEPIEKPAPWLRTVIDAGVAPPSLKMD